MSEQNSTLAMMGEQVPPADKGADPAAGQSLSLGEIVAPLLVLAMEAFLIYAVLLLFAGKAEPLLPLWVLLLMFLGFRWLAGGLKRFVQQESEITISRKLRKTMAWTVLICTTLFCLVLCVWGRFYSQSFSLVDPAWFQALNNTFAQVDKDLQILALAILLAIPAGVNYYLFEKSPDVAQLLYKGGMLLFILAAIGLGQNWMGGNPNFWQTFLLLPVFGWLGLTAQALQKARQKCSRHANDLEGGPRRQEQVIFQMMFLLALVVLVALLGMVLIQTDQAANILHPAPTKQFPQGSSSQMQPAPTAPATSPTHSSNPASFLLPALEISLSVIFGLFMGLFILGMIIISLRLWLRRRRGARREKKQRDETKSLWSWSLLLAQIRALFLALFPFLRWHHREARARGKKDRARALPIAPEVRTIREAYHMFLRKAASSGYPRQLDETPHEFRLRLNKQNPQIEPELETMTEAYVSVRYGSSIPHEDEVARINEIWNKLEHLFKETGQQKQIRQSSS